jgi:O-antigen/teichoic acid export membrane protein
VKLFNYLKLSFLTGASKTIVVSVITLILLPLIINTIGIERYALIAITMLFGGSVVFIDFGISKAVTLLLGRSENQKTKNEIVSDVFLLTGFLLIFISLLCFSLIYFKIPILGNSISVSKNLQHYIIFSGALTLFILMLNNLFISILESYLLNHYVNICHAITSILFNSFLFITGFLFTSDFILVSVPFVSFATISIFYLYIIYKKTDIRLVKPSILRLNRVFPVSIKFFAISVINTIAVPINKYLLLMLSGDLTIIGLYELGFKISLLANSFLNSVAQPLFGVFSNYKNNKLQAFIVAKKVSIIIFFMYFFGVLIFIFVGEYICQLIDTSNSVLLFKISLAMIVFIGFTSISEPFYRAFIGVSLLKKALKYKVIGISSNAILFFIFYSLDPLKRIILSYGFSIVLTSVVIIIVGVKFNKNSI